jgi:aspartyl-tRNA(Asn)/glutamyl-tRNA(Gln) amidotransferase subunit A
MKEGEDMNLLDLSLEEISKKLRNKEISCVELTKEVFKRIDEVEKDVDSFITITKEEALKEAKIVDEKIANGEDIHMLSGIPMAIKDNICTKGIKTTCASKMLEDFIPPYDAFVTKELKNINAICVGKTNMDEFAMGGSTENSAFKATKNPWDITRVPGGSSGGSAACVAAGQAFYALGSDTGGSVRQPASFTGLVGLKPTYGRISRYGLVAFGSSLDQIGTFTRTSKDAAFVLDVLSKKDVMDSTSVECENDFIKDIDSSIEGLKIGVPRELFSEGIDEEVKNAVLHALIELQNLGATFEEINLPNLKYSLSAYYIIAPSEASSNLSRYDGIRFGKRAEEFETLEEMYVKTRSENFGSEVKRRIMIGNYALSSGYYDAYYKKALQVRTLVKEEFEKAFSKYDVIISPTAPNTAFKLKEKLNDPLAMYLEDMCTIPVNLAGLPALSTPCGFDSNNMPIGMQIIGKAFDEKTILKVANAYEKVTEYTKKRASL